MIFKKEGQQPQEVQDSIPRPVDYKRLLKEALEVEDYELAALLRDRIKGLRVRECERILDIKSCLHKAVKKGITDSYPDMPPRPPIGGWRINNP